jgi:hypothetical protein
LLAHERRCSGRGGAHYRSGRKAEARDDTLASPTRALSRGSQFKVAVNICS